MKKIFLAITFLCVTPNCFSQIYSTGLKWDDDKYDKVEKVSSFGGGFGFGETSISKYSLKKFAPKPNNQRSAGSCVTQAVGYGGMTMLKAVKNDWTNKEQITDEALSALYIYNQINNNDCGGGSSYYMALNFLEKEGDVKFNEFEKNDTDNCELNPQSKSYSSKSKIESYTRLFDRNDSENIKINSTKASLRSNNPVLMAFNLTTEFDNREIIKNNYFYKPTSQAERVGGHAMLVVGYDDNKSAFEILNSWGENWGNKGYFYISYKDYAKNCKYAYIMKLKEEVKPEEPKVNLKGTFSFKSIEYKDGSIQKIEQNVTSKGNYYELNKADWQIGSQFQVIANDISKGDYVYVFSIDSSKKPFVHFPKNSKLNNHFFGFGESPIVPFENAEIIIPSKETALTKEKEGTDYLFVLFSELKLDENELSNNIKNLSKSSGNLIENFYSIFKDKLIPSSELNYSKTKMSVNVDTSKGFIAPIILTVK